MVYVMGWTQEHCREMLQLAVKLVDDGDVTISKHRMEMHFGPIAMVVPKNAALIRFKSVAHADWDWATRHIRGISPRTPVFIDHYTIEMYEAGRSHRYD